MAAWMRHSIRAPVPTSVRALAFDGADILVGGDFVADSLGPGITNKILSAGNAVLSASRAHGFTAGDVVVVSIGDAVFDGVHTVTQSDSDPQTIEFALGGADVASTSVSPRGGVSLANRLINYLAKLSGTDGSLITAFSDNVGNGPGGTVRTITKNGSHLLIGGDLRGWIRAGDYDEAIVYGNRQGHADHGERAWSPGG